MNRDHQIVYLRPAKEIRKEAARVLCTGRVSGSRLMTAVLMLLFCLMLSAFSTQAAMYIFELAVPVSGDDMPLWYLVLEQIIAAAALIFAAAPGWAGFGELCGRLVDGYRCYGDSPEQPGVDLRSLLSPWKRGNYLRHVRAGAALIIDIAIPISLLPIGYLCGRYIGWATPRPFDAPVVVLINMIAAALVFAVLRLISMFSLTTRLMCGEKIGKFAAMRRSLMINRFQKGRFFRLRLSFIGWWLLTVASCGLALFWTAPLYGVSRRILGSDMIGAYIPCGEWPPREEPREEPHEEPREADHEEPTETAPEAAGSDAADETKDNTADEKTDITEQENG